MPTKTPPSYYAGPMRDPGTYNRPHPPAPPPTHTRANRSTCTGSPPNYRENCLFFERHFYFSRESIISQEDFGLHPNRWCPREHLTCSTHPHTALGLSATREPATSFDCQRGAPLNYRENCLFFERHLYLSREYFIFRENLLFLKRTSVYIDK